MLFDGVDWLSFNTGPFGIKGLIQLVEQKKANVLVVFSHQSVFEKIVELAVRTNVPLISGTSGLSDRQMAMLYDATNRIPVFRGGNFRFRVKKFIDGAVKLAFSAQDLVLREKFYAGKSLPSETGRVIRRRIHEATGKNIEIFSKCPYLKESLICEWMLDGDGPGLKKGLACKVFGFDELAHDVLEIAKVMATKPVKKGEFYDLDEIWDELPHEV